MFERATPSVSHFSLTVNPPRPTTACPTAAFWAGNIQGLAQEFRLHRLLAEQALQLTDLTLERPVLRGRDDLFLGAGGGQRTLCGQLAPCEELVGLNAVAARHQVHRDAQIVGRLDQQLLGRRPAAALRLGQDRAVRCDQS